MSTLYHHDALTELCAGVVKLAIKDAQAGPGKTTEQRRHYTTAVLFLWRANLLERLRAEGILDVPAPAVSDFWKGGGEISDRQAWAEKDIISDRHEYHRLHREAQKQRIKEKAL